MKLLKMGALEGPNIYSHHPVIKMSIDLQEMHEKTTAEIENFNEGLLGFIPSLGDHHCSSGKPGGFCKRLKEGTMLGHVIEHLALELQAQLGYNVYFGQTRLQGNHYRVVYEYNCKEVGFWAGRQAFLLIKNFSQGKEPLPLSLILQKGYKVKKEADFGPSTQSIVEAAREKDIPVIPLCRGTSLLQLGHGKFSKKVRATITEYTSCIGVDIAGDKWLVRELLSKHGFPFPRGELVELLPRAYEAVNKIGFPVVIKPYNCNQGKGVTLNIRNYHELEEAFYIAKGFSKKIIIEKSIPGRDYRVLVVNGKVVAVSERIAPFVIGDGKHTIRNLIDEVNEDPQRGFGHEKPLTKIKIDEVVNIMLRRQGYTPYSRPSAGAKILLRGNSNLSTGGTAIDVTDCIHPHNKELAVRAADIVGLDVCGIDFVVPDIASPLDKQGGCLIEINAAPGIRMHHFPSQGKPRNAAGAIMEYLFPKASNGRIPLIAVTGTNGKTTVTRLVGHILQQYGLNIGLATTEGLFFNREQMKAGDCTGPRSAKDILTDPRVEAAVLETARGGILREGLGYDWADVAIFTNITEDHLDEYSIKNLDDLWFVKSLLAERVRRDGRIVLNADDPFLVSVVDKLNGNIVLFSKQESNIILKKHLHNEGEAVFLRKGQIVFKLGRREEEICNVTDIPLTWGGIAQHQIENVLAASAAAIVLGLPPLFIKAALQNFNHDLNPGRLQLVDNSFCRVILDYGHNENGFLNVLQTVKKLSYRRLIGVVGMPGDRLDKSISKAGSILAQAGFYKVFIKEDEDLRGRAVGEVARLLQEAFAKTNYTGQLEVCLSEKKALGKALDLADTDDLVLVFYEKDREFLEGLINEKMAGKATKILVSQD